MQSFKVLPYRGYNEAVQTEMTQENEQSGVWPAGISDDTCSLGD